MNLIEYYKNINEAMEYTPKMVYDFVADNYNKLSKKLKIDKGQHKFGEGDEYTIYIDGWGEINMYQVLDLSHEPEDEYDVQYEIIVEYTNKDKEGTLSHPEDIKKLYNFLKRYLKK